MKWLLALIPVGIIMLLLSYVKLSITYIFLNGKSKLNISTSYLFGLIKPEIIPDNNDNNNKQGKKSNGSSKLKFIDYKSILEYVFNKVIIETVKWRTKVGYEDPFYLSIIYGYIWWVKSILSSLILSKKEIDKVNIEVIPYFDHNLFDTRFNCIIKIRMVYIINTWIKLLKINKGGEKNDRTSH